MFAGICFNVVLFFYPTMYRRKNKNNTYLPPKHNFFLLVLGNNIFLISTYLKAAISFSWGKWESSVKLSLNASGVPLSLISKDFDVWQNTCLEAGKSLGVKWRFNQLLRWQNIIYSTITDLWYINRQSNVLRRAGSWSILPKLLHPKWKIDYTSDSLHILY